MKLNNKGVTLVEIIISIALISLVLIFLFSLLIKLNGINKKNDINSTYLVTKALITKNIEEDIKDSTSFSVIKENDCANTFNSMFKRYNEYKNNLSALNKINMCFTINFIDTNSINNTSYLAIYYYLPKKEELENNYDEGKYVISYINNTKNGEEAYKDIKSTRDLPDFVTNNIQEKNGTYEYKYNSNNMILTSSDGNDYLIKIPILGPDGHDYTIVIPYSK